MKKMIKLHYHGWVQEKIGFGDGAYIWKYNVIITQTFGGMDRIILKFLHRFCAAALPPYLTASHLGHKEKAGSHKWRQAGREPEACQV